MAAFDYDKRATHYLVEGFREGFHLRLDRPVNQIASDRKSNKRVVKGNNKTALDNPEAMEAKLVKELFAKRMIGPFLWPVFPAYIISPLGLQKKKVSGKFRVIHNLSAPFESISVNSCIPTKDGAVMYDTVDTAIKVIQRAGQRAILAKTDIEHAYKLIPVHPDDIPALGIWWFQHWLWHATLPMGSRSGCAIFATFSEALQHLAEWQGCGDMCNVLDDFLMVSKDGTLAGKRLRIFLGLCKDLGIPVVEDKMEKGACIIFLGVTLDSIKMEGRLPQDKLEHCLLLVREYLARSHNMVSQLENLNGLLNFACRVVAPGKHFLRRLYSLKEGMKKRLPHYILRLSAGQSKTSALGKPSCKHTMELPCSEMVI